VLDAGLGFVRSGIYCSEKEQRNEKEIDVNLLPTDYLFYRREHIHKAVDSRAADQ